MGEAREREEAFVTLATNNTYALGCLVLGHSLRSVATSRQLVVMITDGVSQSIRDQLGGVFDLIVSVNILDSSDTANLELLGRPDLSVTFTKLHCWRLTQFKKCVFLDADTLVVQNIDELFDREELSAAPDAGWPDCFNSGVFVFVPSGETYRRLLTFAITTGSFDGGDQGLLNLFYSSWATEDIGKHLPFIYNVVTQAFYSYLPALKQFHDDVKVVHFIGALKPWHHSYNTETGTVTQLPNSEGNLEFLQAWWNIFMSSVQPHLDPQLHEPLLPSPPSPHKDKNVYYRLEHTPPPTQNTPPPPYEYYQTYQGNDSQMEHQHRSHHGHGDIRAQPTTSYQVVYPYSPPDLGAPPEDHAHGDAASQSKVMDVPVVYREYNAFETHYSEEPLSAVNPETPPLDHYFASQETQGIQLTESSEDMVPHSDPSGRDEQQNDDGSGERGQSVARRVDSVDVPNHEGGQRGGDEGQVPPETEDENGNVSEKGGLVGDLASLTMADDGSTTKSDRERRSKWEQGQADYLGVDKFDNIKARLDEKIQKPSPTQSQTKLDKE